MKIYNNNDTIIAPLTPALGGSIAVLRISGPNAVKFAAKYFSKKDLESSEGGKFYHGSIVGKKGALIDEVVLLVYKQPNSYTGENVIEINSHANPFIIDQMVELFISEGCRIAEPGEFSKRAFLNGKMDLVQAEAVANLIAAKSSAGVKNSLFQLNGKLSQKIQALKKEIIDITSLLELDLDFSQDDIEIVSADKILQVLHHTEKSISQLLNTYEHGKTINKGVDVLITGKPNVGKSSLMNALLDENRVIVSDAPGTTRDIINEQALIDNVLVRFLDSAGIHLSYDSVESEGIERAKEYFAKADVILLVADISESLTRDDLSLIKTTRSFYKDKMILIGNKTDKAHNTKATTELKKYDDSLLFASATTGAGVEEIKKRIISNTAIRQKTDRDELLITNKRHFVELTETRKSLLKAKNSIEAGAGFEFVTIDMRAAIDHLSEITGEITTDDILNNIFSDFCIGK